MNPRFTEEVQTFPEKRIVLLGASNLISNIATVLETARGIWSAPADMLIAAGYGRSYGSDSHVLGRTLPSIADCGIWSALERRPVVSTAALVTDIGNDLAYGFSVEQIIRWVKLCIQRLAELDACIVLTQLPLDSLDALERWKYHFFRMLLFPQCRLSLELIRERAHELNAHLIELAQNQQLPIIRPRLDWYGFDPIHIRYRARGSAWREIMGPWNERPGGEDSYLGSVRTWCRLTCMRPLRRTLFGIQQVKHQPCGVLGDGSLISLF